MSLFFFASLETKAINLGVWGSAPLLCLAFWFWDRQRIYAGCQIPVILAGCQLCQIPLIPVMVVIICPVRNGVVDIVKGLTSGQIDLIFHMTKEGLLWCVIPAVCFPGHGLSQITVLQQLDEFYAGIVCTPVTVDQCFCMERYLVLLHQLLHSFQYKINFQ